VVGVFEDRMKPIDHGALLSGHANRERRLAMWLRFRRGHMADAQLPMCIWYFDPLANEHVPAPW